MQKKRAERNTATTVTAVADQKDWLAAMMMKKEKSKKKVNDKKTITRMNCSFCIASKLSKRIFKYTKEFNDQR